jgi:two-component system, NarL family, nitrate/nitrite response regulator NarL
VVLLSAFTDARVVAHAMRAGAAGYLAKDLDREALVTALDRALAGERPTIEEAVATAAARDLLR